MTDIVASTELASRLGPVRSDKVRQEHFAGLGCELELYGGRFVKSTGDGLMAAFESASSAVACGVAMQLAVERMNLGSVDPVEIRIGVATGEAAFEDGDYFGRPCVEAARLCAPCPGGAVVVTAMVRALAGRVDDLLFDPIGMQDLKGLPEPVEVFSVSRQLPHPDERLLERDSELGVLAVSVRAARSGAGAALLVLGSAGIGKSSLLDAANGFAGGERVRVLRARGNGLERDFAFGIVRQLFEPLVRVLDSEARESLFSGAAAPAARVFGDASEPGASAGESPDIAHGLYWVISGLAAETPFVLLVDDAHWSDRPSLRVLVHLARRVEGLPVALIVSARPHEPRAAQDLIDALAEGPGVAVVRPGPKRVLGRVENSPVAERVSQAVLRRVRRREERGRLKILLRSDVRAGIATYGLPYRPSPWVGGGSPSMRTIQVRGRQTCFSAIVLNASGPSPSGSRRPSPQVPCRSSHRKSREHRLGRSRPPGSFTFTS
jgi:class 3 adenylate cyclase